MKPRRECSTRLLAASLLLLCLDANWKENRCLAESLDPPDSDDSAKLTAPQRVSLEDYRNRLQRLRLLAENCSRQASTATCAPSLVGPDLLVELPSGERSVQLAWLRSVMRAASGAASVKDPKAKDAALKNAADGLRDAIARLDQDLAEQPGSGKDGRDVAPERATLKAILASGNYAEEVPPSLFERLRDEFLEWLQRRLNSVGASQASQLLANLFMISLIAVACGAMLWWFARKVQNQRMILPLGYAPHPSAPSSQDWQQWLTQARAFAAERHWREAIHHVYWSAISCLESRGLWPADRARTPREYLGLLTARPEKHADLDALTRSFERTWYGDQTAGQAQFDQACALLERLAAR